MNLIYFIRCTQNGSVAAYSLLEYALGYCPVQMKHGQNGKPYLPYSGLHFNISHTKGAAVCAVSDRPVGIDIEHTCRIINPRLPKRYYTAKEQAYAADNLGRLEIWTRKEALLKHSGKGITVQLCQMETVNHPLINTCQWDSYMLSVCSENPVYKIIDIGSL